MARYKEGILGPFHGTIGTVTGGSWKGVEYMKSRNIKSNKARTMGQLEQQAKFNTLIKFVSSMGKLLMVTFDEPGIKMTGTNRAFSYNYYHALKGIYPLFRLDYPKVLVSSGRLHNVDNPVASDAGNGEIKMTWEDNSGIAMADETDRCITVAYCPELGKSIYEQAGARRSNKIDVLNAGNFIGREVETWISFILPMVQRWPAACIPAV